MPPPRSIPGFGILNRPHSMYNHNRLPNHSPPVNSSPLSPPSGAYSTESEGSSYSIDETDGFTPSMTPEEGTGFSAKNMK